MSPYRSAGKEVSDAISFPQPAHVELMSDAAPSTPSSTKATTMVASRGCTPSIGRPISGKTRAMLHVPLECNPEVNQTALALPPDACQPPPKRQDRKVSSQEELHSFLNQWSPFNPSKLLDAAHGSDPDAPFKWRHFVAALGLAVKTRHPTLDSPPLIGDSPLAAKVLQQAEQLGHNLGHRRAYVACITNAGGRQCTRLRHRLALGVLGLWELLCIFVQRATPKMQEGLIIFETASIQLFMDEEGTVREIPVAGSMTGQMPKFTDVTPVPPSELHSQGNKESSTISAKALGLTKIQTEVSCVGPACVQATFVRAVRYFKLEHWANTDFSASEKVEAAMGAVWDLLMALFPIYTEAKVAKLCFGSTGLGGLHSEGWVKGQYSAVGWSKEISNLIYMDALSYVVHLKKPLCLKSQVSTKQIPKVDTGQWDEYAGACADEWLQANIDPRILDANRSLESRAQLASVEGFWLHKEEWCLNMSRAKLCAMAMMGAVEAVPALEQPTFMQLPIHAIDGGGTRWQLMVFEELFRQQDRELASRAVFPLLPGCISEEKAAQYEREALVTYNPFRRAPCRLVVIEVGTTSKGFVQRNSGRMSNVKMVAVVHLQPSHAPVVFLLSSWIQRDGVLCTGGKPGKWTGGWSGASDVSTGLRDVFAALAHIFSTDEEGKPVPPWFNPRHYIMLNKWYEERATTTEKTVVWSVGSVLLRERIPELTGLIGGDDGLADLERVRAMDWVTRPSGSK